MPLAAVAALACAAQAAETLTYADLIARMTRPELLAVLPPAGEACAQWSSYDRASRYDAATDKYVNWDANGDGNGVIRTEGDAVVMAEMQGPGCIFRIWSALSQQGRVKIYLDGNPEPVVNLPFKEYFTGKTAPFDFPALSYHLEEQGSRGENLYFPIPYGKSCKITAEKGWGAYYHFNYVTFPPGTNVPTFTGVLAPEDRAALAAVNAFMRDGLGGDPAGPRQGEETAALPIALAPGAATSLAIEGPRAITAIKAALRFENRAAEEAALRGLLLAIEFDSLAAPAVWCPLGDFFGTAPGINRYRSLMTGMTPEGAYAYWYMPFEKHATIRIVNEDAVPRGLELRITHAPLGRPFAGLGYFHAKWHRDIFPLPRDRAPDWTMLRTSGRGRFAGVMLHVWNPRGGWWGEGDEKFFVDGEKFPSTIGTGSEDYFGYAWCHPGLFQRPYHAQTMTQDNRGHQSVLRWHLGDAVPFQKSFEACIEKYYPNSRGTLYACVACWYLSPDGVDPIGPTPAAERHGYAVPLPPGGAGFEVVGQFRGSVEEQDMAGWGAGKWHGDRQLWWTGARPGDTLDIRLNVAETGTYKVTAHLTKAVDYGIVRFFIDKLEAGGPIDLYNDGVVPSGPVDLGTHRLEKGAHTLTVKITGANDKAVKGYMFGLHRLVLDSVK
jgi:hypothetical protein